MKQLSLSNLSKMNLSKIQERAIIGGSSQCGCVCSYTCSCACNPSDYAEADSSTFIQTHNQVTEYADKVTYADYM